MKHLTLLFCTIFFFLLPICVKAQAQQQSYHSLWEKIDSAEQRGLPRTAWDVAKKIYANASKKGDEQQQIKALIYQLKYRKNIEENALIKNMLEADSLSGASKGTAQALLQNLAANLYLDYVHQNRYRLQRRITSGSENKEGPATWSLPHFYKHIDSLFQQSLHHQKTLQQLKVKDYTVLIDSGKNSLSLRPTVFDVLAHNALQFYTSSQDVAFQSAHHFIINNPHALGSAKKFSTISFPSADSLSPILKALKIYQTLTRFHLNDTSPNALIDVSLERINYVYKKGVIKNKDSLYRQVLRHVISRYAVPAKYKATAMLAQWYYAKGATYSSGNPKNRWAYEKALQLCNKVPEDIVNEGALTCQKLKDNILRKTIGLNVERVNVPEKPFRVLVSYKNLDTLWFKIVKLKEDPESVYNRKITLSELSEKEVVSLWNQRFPLPKDYQEHAAEMKVIALPTGRYAIIASADPSFKNKNRPIVYAAFYVSNLSYVTDNNEGILVVNRTTGEPIKKAKIRLWERHYSSSLRKYELQPTGRYKTDADGYAKLGEKLSKNHGNYLIPEITTNDDHLFIPNGYYIPYSRAVSSKSDEVETHALLFTDRSIYRPGQTLYFKGILYQVRPNKADNVLADKTVKVFLYNANAQIVDSTLLTSNKFGSFSSTFHLPDQVLNGRMHISIDSINASGYFRVEEYKRPTFDLTWDSLAITHQLGDSVHVSGIVMGYNNVPVGHATIKYQVTRKRFIYPFYRRPVRSRMIIYPIKNAVISEGTIHSTSSGTFTVPFQAIPDEEVPQGRRIFNYEVSVDVTGTNGESHHYSYTLPIGDESLLLQLEMKNKSRSNDFDSLHIVSTDLSGKFVPTPVAFSLYALQAPNRFIRKRYWREPDQFLMDKKEFIHLFPHDEYKAEADIKNWKVNHPVYVSRDTTNKDGYIAFHYPDLLPGRYLIKATAKDKYGHFITDSQYIQVYKPSEKELPFHQVLWTNTGEIKAGPRQEIAWHIGSSEKAVIFEETEKLNSAGNLQNFRLNSRIKKEELKTEPGDRGGIIRHYVTVRYNRVFTQDVKILIPWKYKQLHITYETFRNKILPGEKESWTVKITGKDHQKVNAELLASMYDLSLDNFTPHNWSSFSDLYPTTGGQIRWDGNNAFSEITGRRLSDYRTKKYPDFRVVYPYLKRFGYDQNRRYHRPPASPFPGRPMTLSEANGISPGLIRKNAVSSTQQLSEKVVVGFSKQKDAVSESAKSESTPGSIAPIRKNFNETAFFYPQLHTDDSGNVSFTFTAPEALTRWKLMLFAHTKDLKFAYSEKETVTQKPLMIQLNAPRFARQGDQLVLSAKVSNLSEKMQSGDAVLHFKNTVTGKTISLVQSNSNRSFTVKPHQSISLKWSVSIPKNYTDALTYIVTARSDQYSDGEQNILPVLTNKTRITESKPFHFSGNGDHLIHWDELTDLKKENIQPEKLTLEYTGNPIWYAVQALPFLDKETRKSADAIFRKIYANALSSYIALKIPHFKNIMEQWLTSDTNGLKSSLQKNQELKNVLLQETPWVRIAQSEAAQKATVAHWYEDDDFQLRLKSSIIALKDMQMENGGFSWFKDMPDNRHVTQEIAIGLGHLKALHAWPHIAFHDLKQIINKAVPYLDNRMKENYDRLKKEDRLKNALSALNVQYLYMRSFFPDVALPGNVREAYNYFYNKATKEWTQQNTYTKAMLALTFHRKGNNQLAIAVLHSLKETMIKGHNGGLHWKQQAQSYLWYRRPITTQALCIEAFRDLDAGQDTINALRTWLLNQKQTQFWPTNKATANAVYALLLSGSDWTASHPVVHIKMGDSSYVIGKNDSGLQYRKIIIPGAAVSPKMATIHLSIQGAGKEQPAWGAAYVQYFNDMNRVETGKGSDLHIERQISLETNTAQGKHLSPISSSTQLKVGDKVQVRLIVKADRDMDFIHLKDVRASCMEPIQVLSGYHWNNGTGYYSTVSDAAVHFYFQHLPKGTYVFTYPVYITQSGHFTGGLSQIECLYAPEIRAHSEGVSLEIK